MLYSFRHFTRHNCFEVYLNFFLAFESRYFIYNSLQRTIFYKPFHLRRSELYFLSFELPLNPFARKEESKCCQEYSMVYRIFQEHRYFENLKIITKFATYIYFVRSLAPQERRLTFPSFCTRYFIIAHRVRAFTKT